jgi:quinohemoprotein amine dehydrogenase
MMSRISYERKSPEGWEQSLKRMIRLYSLQITPADARQIVRYLADEHGLTRSEAERSLYESERRVHWSEEHNDQDLRNACAVCHPLGRVLAQARDDEEWQLLRATHVAMFPLARGQMGGGPPPDETERARFGGGNQGGNAGANQGGNAGGRAGRGGAQGAAVQAVQANQGPGGQGFGGFGNDAGDRVLQRLAQTQPLFTPEWEAFALNRREVPLAGTWTVTGHQTGKGELLGTAEMKRVGIDEYDVTWKLSFSNGDRIERSGRGVIYAGYSWRGSYTDPGDTTPGATDASKQAQKWREVLLLDERWETMHGRFFAGDYDELGIDVHLVRHRGIPRVLAIETPWVTVPAKEQKLDVFGEHFPEAIAAADFHCGKGVTVTGCERIAENHVRLLLDVAPNAECGSRVVAYGSEPGQAQIQLYDAVDYVRIRPLQGLARVGGGAFPKQYERYEAVAVHRGKDGKAFTDDDVDLWTVPAQWKLVEAAVRDDDDDLGFIGSIDAATGLFTPAIDGPNSKRKWSGNNTGEVYVECTVDLHVPERIEPPKEEPKAIAPAKPAAAPAPDAHAGAGEGDQNGSAEPGHGTPSDASQGPQTQQPQGQQAQGQQPPTPPPATQQPATQQPPSQEPGHGEPAQPNAPHEQPQDHPGPANTAPPAPVPTSGQPKIVARTFHARAHLIVTVPLYVRWTRLEWEDK